jgi:hypothetical protein
MFDDLITRRLPPPNRLRSCDGDLECHLTEGAVMLAFAMHLLRTVPGLAQVKIHPDGEHAKGFDFEGWLKKRGFFKTSSFGKTTFGGVYSSSTGHSIVVNPASGRGDVSAEIDGQSIVAECKGGIVNTRHPGQQSRLRRGLCEAVGLLLASPALDGRRQFAVVPHTRVTENLARLMAPRARTAGIEIALVDDRGSVRDIRCPEM